MSTTEFPAQGPGAGTSTLGEVNRAKPMVLRNSRILCWVTMSGSFFALVMGVCMGLMVVSLLFLQSGSMAGRAISALEWAAGGLAMFYMCMQLWNLGRAMLGYQVLLNGRGVTFNLGTKRNPADLFMPWDQVKVITLRRDVNVQRCSVHGSDGSQATFSSYTFFRPKKVARMIAERAGVTIQRA
jgi:hypothetical protein